MRLPPPEVVASWPVPNYINPEKQGPTLLIVELTTLSIALICLGLRLYARKQRLGVLAADDWLMIAAAVRAGPPLSYCVIIIADAEFCSPSVSVSLPASFWPLSGMVGMSTFGT